MATNKNFNSKLFAKDVISFRENNSLTVPKMAAKANVSTQTIFNAEIENSQVMGIANVIKICNAISQPLTKYL